VHATRSACEGSPWWRATRQAEYAALRSDFLKAKTAGG